LLKWDYSVAGVSYVRQYVSLTNRKNDGGTVTGRVLESEDVPRTYNLYVATPNREGNWGIGVNLMGDKAAFLSNYVGGISVARKLTLNSNVEFTLGMTFKAVNFSLSDIHTSTTYKTTDESISIENESNISPDADFGTLLSFGKYEDNSSGFISLALNNLFAPSFSSELFTTTYDRTLLVLGGGHLPMGDGKYRFYGRGGLEWIIGSSGLIDDSKYLVPSISATGIIDFFEYDAYNYAAGFFAGGGWNYFSKTQVFEGSAKHGIMLMAGLQTKLGASGGAFGSKVNWSLRFGFLSRFYPFGGSVSVSPLSADMLEVFAQVRFNDSFLRAR
jgi:hypothetical protein